MFVDDLWQHQPPVRGGAPAGFLTVVAPAQSASPGPGPSDVANVVVGEVLHLSLQVQISRVGDRAQFAEFRQQISLVVSRTDRSCVGPATHIIQDFLVKIINNSLNDQTQVAVGGLQTSQFVPKYSQLIKVKLFLS